MATTLLLGSTGMVGAFILSTLRAASPERIASVDILARRSPPPSTSSDTSTNTGGSGPTSVALNAFIETDTSKWSSHISSLGPSAPDVIFSALATTRGAAGSFEKQYVLEHDLNVTLARAARENGAKVYVLISGAGANRNAFFNYTKMKGEIEDDIKALDFDHTVIVRPGLIGGHREESRPAEAVIRRIADVMGMVSGNRLKDFWAQDADVIARAAVSAGLKAQRGEFQGKVTVLEQGDIIKLGRTEWKDI